MVRMFLDRKHVGKVGDLHIEQLVKYNYPVRPYISPLVANMWPEENFVYREPGPTSPNLIEVNKFGFDFKTMLSLKELAISRIGGLLLKSSGFSREALIETSDRILLVRHSPNLEIIRGQGITDSTSSFWYYKTHIDQGKLEAIYNYLDGEKGLPPQKRAILEIPASDYNSWIETKDFNLDERTLWAFQELAREYGDFLYDNGIKKINFGYPGCASGSEREEKPFSRQLCFSALEGLSESTGAGIHGALGTSLEESNKIFFTNRSKD